MLEEFHMDDNMKDITVKRQMEDGYELIAIQTPCMLTAIKELNEPRYMSMAGIFGKKDIKVWNAKDIEVDLNKVGLEASRPMCSDHSHLLLRLLVRSSPEILKTNRLRIC